MSDRPNFEYHNVRLPDGTSTVPSLNWYIADSPWLLGPVRMLRRIYGNDISSKSIADLGALEGAYALEFAKLGMETVGLEIRQSNFERCQFLKDAFDLPNLRFCQDDCWNLPAYGSFDAIFCSGLLYHLDKPVEFIKLLSRQARDAVFIQTHFAPEEVSEEFQLGDIQQNEGMPGRWYIEHNSSDPSQIETYRLSSFHNQKSFWLTRPAILQALNDSGFDIVLEQHDAIGGASILEAMSGGYYRTHHRGMFVGLRSGSA